MSRKLARIVALTALVCAAELGLSASLVRASPLFDLLGDTGATGGLQARTTAGGAAAAYFNPSLLVDAPAGLSVGFLVVAQGITVSLEGRPGTEFAVPEGIQNAGRADGARFENYPIATNLLQFGRMKDARRVAFIARPRQAAGSGHDTLTYETVGLVIKLFDDYVSLGMHMLIPNGQFTQMRAFFNDEREQYFSNSLHPELYSDRLLAVSLALGVGIKLTDELSLGIGATLGLKADVVAAAYVADTGDLGNILIEMNAPVNIGIAPHFGLTYEPTRRLRLSASVHTPQQVELGSKFKFLISNGVEQQSGVKLVLDYTPWQVALGGAYDVWVAGDHTLSVAASLLYGHWSDYFDRHGSEPTSAYAWADTLTPMAGVRYRFGGLATLVDLAYVPTPVPKQTGRSNYVDNDRLSATLGGEYGFEWLGQGMTIGGGFQLHRLLPRSQVKLRTPTLPDGEVVAPERVRDEVPDDAQLGGDPCPAPKVSRPTTPAGQVS